MEPNQSNLLVPTINLQQKTVPNEYPKVETPYRIAVIGESPGQQEEVEGRPFVGPSGHLLDALLSSAGILRSACLVGNVCQIRPPANEIGRFDWNGVEIQTGLEQLRSNLSVFRPNVVVLLGKTALHATLEKDKDKITDWRGSLFVCQNSNSPLYKLKCLPSLHPANILRQWDGMPLLLFDLKRARQEADSPSLTLPQRRLDIELSPQQIIERLDEIQSGTLVSIDIEGGLDAWTMISVSTHPLESFCICFSRFSLDEEIRILESLGRLLYDSRIPKVLQNCLYDNFVLSYGFKMPIRNVWHDTMLKGWELYPELPKGLGVQASIWTRQPFYKVSHSAKARKERLTNDNMWQDYQRYCCNDSAVTLEISKAQDQVLTGTPQQHYRFNMDMLSPLLYMELRGIRYDSERAASLLAETNIHYSEVKTRVDLRTAGYSVFGPKAISHKKLADFLYRRLGHPIQDKKEKGRLTTSETTDVEALLTLAKKTQHPILYDLLELSRLESDQETLSIKADEDVRVRCAYNVVGTETGRLTCYTSPTGSGANLQTITKKLRSLYVADSGFDLFQCDLAGADGWTVAAHCARLGDTTMLQDYYHGIKPAKVIALMHDGVAIPNNRDAILELSKTVDPDSWLYFACKRVQHATNYGIGWVTGTGQIVKDSYKLSGKPIYITKAQWDSLQSLYFQRYRGVRLWQDWIRSVILNARGFPKLPSASGCIRTFFGRKGSKLQVDHETFKEMLAHEPQVNTTYATNLAMLRLWKAPENRRPNGSLIIEPLHQIHDALVGQWPSDVRDWAKAKVKECFQNPLSIGGLNITIPFDGGWGRSWGELKEKI